MNFPSEKATGNREQFLELEIHKALDRGKAEVRISLPCLFKLFGRKYLLMYRISADYI